MKSIRVLCILLLLCRPAKSQIITSIAGNGTGGDGGPATSASLFDPVALVYDTSYNLFFTEALSNIVRRIDRHGTVIRIAGIGSSFSGYNGDGIPATDAMLNIPHGLASDKSGNVYIADVYNNRVRRIDAVSGLISTYCGDGSATSSGDGGPASAATIKYPMSICIDAIGRMYIAEQNKVRKIDTNGIISTIAGDGMLGETGDGGPATAARISSWFGIDVDYTGNVYVTGKYVIRKISPLGIISTIAGDTSSYLFNGDNRPATSVTFAPSLLKYDNQRRLLYVADGYNNRIRVIDESGIINTIAGTGVGGNSGDGGSPLLAMIDKPSGIVLDSCNNIIFGQIDVPRIRKITYDGCLVSSGLPSNQPTTDLSIYPNPTNDILNINTPASAGYRLADAAGRVLVQGPLAPGHNQLPLHQLAPGMYLLTINNKEGSITKKIVKE